MFSRLLPIWQAPMAGVSTLVMAAAASQAGGLGGISVGHLDLTKARVAIQQTELAGLPFNVNLFVVKFYASYRWIHPCCR